MYTGQSFWKKYYQYNFITYSLHITLRLKLFSTHSWSLTKKNKYSCGLDNSILEKVKKITNVVYKKVEIKYTVLHVMQSCSKNANVMHTGQGNKEHVSQDLKDGFLMFLLITCWLMLIVLRKLTQKIVNQLTN